MRNPLDSVFGVVKTMKSLFILPRWRSSDPSNRGCNEGQEYKTCSDPHGYRQSHDAKHRETDQCSYREEPDADGEQTAGPAICPEIIKGSRSGVFFAT